MRFDRDPLAEGIAVIVSELNIGVPATIELRESLNKTMRRFVSELELWNPKLGLVQAHGNDLIIKHILDCLAPLPLLTRLLQGRQSPVLADVGSGAGLPGIPLAVALSILGGDFAQNRFFLVEKQLRRVNFLRNSIALMGPPGLKAEHQSLEECGADIASGKSPSCDVVTTRAFRPLEKTNLAELRGLLKADGLLFLYKGRREKINAELEGCGISVPIETTKEDRVPEDGKAGVYEVKVPFLEEERHVVVIGRK